jgi:hypothetical protein
MYFNDLTSKVANAIFKGDFFARRGENLWAIFVFFKGDLNIISNEFYPSYF